MRDVAEVLNQAVERTKDDLGCSRRYQVYFCPGINCA